MCVRAFGKNFVSRSRGGKKKGGNGKQERKRELICRKEKKKGIEVGGKILSLARVWLWMKRINPTLFTTRKTPS